MKNTILNKKDAELIEEAILKYGQIISTAHLLKIFQKKYKKNSAYNRIQKLYKLGWLLRIKKGLYLIVDNITSRSMNTMSLLRIAQALHKNSYISLNWALNYYQMFDQYSHNIISINYQISKKYKFSEQNFRFIKISKKYYFGFTQIREEGKLINIASREKALIDYLYLMQNFYAANLVFEKIKEHQTDIDFLKLQKYILKYGVSMQRKIGFLLDQINIDTNFLFKKIQKRNIGFSKFTKESKKFNAKWRIYYEDRIIN